MPTTSLPLMDTLAERVNADKSALIIVDVQPDFMPGGALACEQGHEIVPLLNTLLSRGIFKHIVATQDWHPPQHVSFARHHPGRQAFDTITLYGCPQTLWPVHCVANTPGAALHPEVDWRYATLILRKGTVPDVDGYSAFRHNMDHDGHRITSGLAAWLHAQGITHVYVCGLARDVCVLWSAEDAADAGFNTTVLWPLTRPVTSAHDNVVRATLDSKGIRVLS